MKRPSKKEIKAAVDALKNKNPDQIGGQPNMLNEPGKLAGKKTSQRIRKQGI